MQERNLCSHGIFFRLQTSEFRTSSHDSDWPGWPVFMRGRAVSVTGLEILPYEYFSPVTGKKAGCILAVQMASSCIACCIFHIISIPFNCSDTAWRVAEATTGAKVKLLCFAMFALFLKFGARTRSRGLWPFLISETGLKFLIWTKRALSSLVWTHGGIHTGNRVQVIR